MLLPQFYIDDIIKNAIDNTKKFGALYPSSPNKEKFLKLMKP